MSKKNIIGTHSFLLLAHYATFAYQDLLFEYLNKNKARMVTKINLPLPELPNLKRIEITHCANGTLTGTKVFPSLYKPPIIAYIFQSIQLFFIILFGRESYDMVIAEDSSLAVVGILLRAVKKCKTVVFYSHGIDKKRFKYKFLNKFYQLIDKVAAINCNFNWSLNINIKTLRKKYGINEKTLFWIPASIATNSVTRKTAVFNHKVVFLGVLSNKNGADLLPKIILKLRKDIPDVTLDIIGEGELSNKLRANVKKMHLEKNIKFLGFMEFEGFSKILTNYSVGIAPYEDDLETLNSSSDSLKMRIYLTAGLPVVITRGVSSSKDIQQNKLGEAVGFNAESFAKALKRLLTNKKLNLSIRKKALAYSKTFDIINIYNKTFNEMFQQIRNK